MEATYYIPKIEDIHLGLAIEHWQVNMNFHSDPLDANSYYTEKWVKCLVTKENIKDAIEYVLMEKENEIPTCIRVKHLDREDIEGEGWATDESRNALGALKFVFLPQPEPNTMTFFGVLPYVIYFHQGYVQLCKAGTDESVLQLKILNLTEFRKLMKQLRIKKL